MGVSLRIDCSWEYSDPKLRGGAGQGNASSPPPAHGCRAGLADIPSPGIIRLSLLTAVDHHEPRYRRCRRQIPERSGPDGLDRPYPSRPRRWREPASSDETAMRLAKPRIDI